MRLSNHNSRSSAAIYSLLDWVCDGYLWFKTQYSKTRGQCVFINSTPWVLCPFNQSLSLTKSSNTGIVSSVPGLLFVSRPRAVAWTVVAVIVFAIQFQMWSVARCFSPGLKLTEVVEPLSAYGDATTAIFGVVFALGPIATFLHSRVDSVNSVVFELKLGGNSSTDSATGQRTKLFAFSNAGKPMGDGLATSLTVVHTPLLIKNETLVKSLEG